MKLTNSITLRLSRYYTPGQLASLKCTPRDYHAMLSACIRLERAGRLRIVRTDKTVITVKVAA